MCASLHVRMRLELGAQVAERNNADGGGGTQQQDSWLQGQHAKAVRPSWRWLILPL